jgi:hypothetical protein
MAARFLTVRLSIFIFIFFIFASRLYGKEWHETRVGRGGVDNKRKTEHQDVDSFFFSIDPFFPSFSGSLAVVGGKESLYSGICFLFGER